MTQLQFNLNMDVLKDSVMNSNIETVMKSTIVLVLNAYMELERDQHMNGVMNVWTTEMAIMSVI